jgi:hypothetical protein
MTRSQSQYSISYYKPERLVQLTWLPGTETMTNQDFGDVLWVFAAAALRHPAERLIIDMRQFMYGPSAEILEWRDQVIVPMYIQAGIRKIAWIWPGETGTRTTTGDRGSYENRYCASEDEALTWILAEK